MPIHSAVDCEDKLNSGRFVSRQVTMDDLYQDKLNFT